MCGFQSNDKLEPCTQRNHISRGKLAGFMDPVGFSQGHIQTSPVAAELCFKGGFLELFHLKGGTTLLCGVEGVPGPWEIGTR